MPSGEASAWVLRVQMSGGWDRPWLVPLIAVLCVVAVLVFCLLVCAATSW